MRAIVMRAFGAPDVLQAEEVVAPVAGPGQVLVAVAVAGITFVETQVRAGRAPHPSMAPALPAIPGNGVGGVVVATGEGADPALVGRWVVASTGGTGGYAERVAAGAAGLIEVPAALSLAQAVALLADGRTALALLRGAAPRPGEAVLVEAAGGGVGSLLVQLARDAGARVVATAGGRRKLDLARELGAAVAVDYTAPDWPERVRAALGGGGVDVAFDGVGGEIGRAAAGLVRAGGRFCPFGMASGRFAGVSEAEAAGRGVTLVPGARPSPAQSVALSRAALEAAAAGRLRPTIGQTFPLEQAAAAHAAIESRATLGKTLLLTGDPGAAPGAG